MIGKRFANNASVCFACTIILVFAALVPSAQARAPLLDQQRGLLTLAPLLETVTPAVVSIAVQSRVAGADNPLFNDPFFRRFFGLPDGVPERRSISAGSGVIVDAEKGRILTNHHVVKNADRIRVTVKSGREFEAKLVGSDEATDLAVLEVEPHPDLAALPLGDSDDLRVGDLVLAIGNPFGLGQTVTSGIVSALGRAGLSTENYEDFIQTDAPINPGNSGGALVNTRGELMGINTAIIAPAGGNVGIGFAVPSNMARAVMEQILKHGEVRRGRIGILVQAATPEIAEALGAPVHRGAVISAVEAGSPAEDAGLKAGDLVIAIDGKPVSDSNDVRNRIGLREIGSTVEVTYFRGGETYTTNVLVGEPQLSSLDGGDAIAQLSGATFKEIPPEHPLKGRTNGLLVAEVEVGSAAWRVGLRSGDIIVAVNQREVRSPSDLRHIAEASRGALALSVLRNGRRLFIIARG